MADTKLDFNCNVCGAELFDSTALLTSCGHLFCVTTPGSNSRCTTLEPGKPGPCDLCQVKCTAGTLEKQAEGYDAKVKRFVLMDLRSDLRELAEILEFRNKHRDILSFLLSRQRKKNRLLQEQVNNLMHENAALKQRDFDVTALPESANVKHMSSNTRRKNDHRTEPNSRSPGANTSKNHTDAKKSLFREMNKSTATNSEAHGTQRGKSPSRSQSKSRLESSTPHARITNHKTCSYPPKVHTSVRTSTDSVVQQAQRETALLDRGIASKRPRETVELGSRKRAHSTVTAPNKSTAKRPLPRSGLGQSYSTVVETPSFQAGALRSNMHRPSTQVKPTAPRTQTASRSKAAPYTQGTSRAQAASSSTAVPYAPSQWRPRDALKTIDNASVNSKRIAPASFSRFAASSSRSVPVMAAQQKLHPPRGFHAGMMPRPSATPDRLAKSTRRRPMAQNPLSARKLQ